MARKKVVGIFSLTSLLMWVLPIGVLHVFNHNLIPGLENLSPRSRTLWSGGLAVLSVNLVIAVYILLAAREAPVADAPHPDPAFASTARARLEEFSGNRARSAPEKSDKSD